MVVRDVIADQMLDRARFGIHVPDNSMRAFWEKARAHGVRGTARAIYKKIVTLTRRAI